MSENVLGSRAEIRAEHFSDSRTISARLGFRSDKRTIFGLGSAVGRTDHQILSECAPLVLDVLAETHRFDRGEEQMAVLLDDQVPF